MHVAICNSMKTKCQQNFNNARINSLRLKDGGESSTRDWKNFTRKSCHILKSVDTTILTLRVTGL